jgi:hypothetical protein
MNALRGTILGLAIVWGASTCSAQQEAIPFEKIAKDAQLSATLTLTGNEPSSEFYSSRVSSESSNSGSGFTRGTSVPVRRRTLGPSFYLLNGLSFGIAALDVELTQHCISTHKCHEGNPLIPSSHAGALGISFALVGSGTWASYQMKKHESHIWWIAPISGIAGHTVGVTSGLIHR